MKTIIKVDGMSCNHCANKIKESLESILGVKEVSVNIDLKEVVILSDKELDMDSIKEKIESLGYKVI